ncbi:lipopolysaccharide heptosyltransferase II [Thioalkalivibrio paradoxus]|uniref:lipopolysaccharide heptosyltransferase II n=1 Tax=Thioalkalivibrio paradoxus ARh 1 TaxID=713585 RepID=W0DKA4_9GAMM|nr:lipopolysaccharide heptosyltransferase II [Thioalkalivibrio paradoxus]AHE97320.1 ADP-heptose--LPS heptosyltransferase [Thioalkalivibrio paradoxus ARh 1]
MSAGAAHHPLLVVGPAWVGDMIMAQSLFITLNRSRPNAPIDVIAPPWSLPILERMPEVRRGIALPVAHGELALRRRWQLGRRLRAEGYAQAIVLPRSAKAALPVFAAGIPRRTGYRGEFRYGLLNDIRPLDRKRLYRTVDRFVNLGLAPDAALPAQLPEPRLRIHPATAAGTATALGLNAEAAPVLALCPGAEYGPAKRWPEEHFARVARDRLARGWQVWLLGSDRDRTATAAIAATAPGAFDLAGRTALAQAVDLLSLARAVVSNDSGLMHVAAAVDVPLIALYGSSDPNYTPPLNAKARILTLGLDCSPCFRRECPLEHLNCLRQLAPERVIALLDKT